ncbi:MAG: hypothetical protein K8L91_17360 [Anaerolineae bacterium]|nr:hypothetical protein [Anaerolineae bacterium]
MSVNSRMIDESIKRYQIRVWFFKFGKKEPESMGCLETLGDMIFNGAKKLDEHEKIAVEYRDQLKKWGFTLKDLNEFPPTSQIEAWLVEDLSRVVKLALQRLGLVREELVREPMLIYGPLFWKTYGIPDHELVVAKDPEGKLHYSCNQLVVICLSESRIATYSADYNFLRNVFLNEKTVEYLYRDIVSVSTETKATNYSLPDGQTLKRTEVFRLAVASGDNIEVAINSPEIRGLFQGEPNLSNHEASVRVIREMLRTKKG